MIRSRSENMNSKSRGRGGNRIRNRSHSRSKSRSRSKSMTREYVVRVGEGVAKAAVVDTVVEAGAETGNGGALLIGWDQTYYYSHYGHPPKLCVPPRLKLRGSK